MYIKVQARFKREGCNVETDPRGPMQMKPFCFCEEKWLLRFSRCTVGGRFHWVQKRVRNPRKCTHAPATITPPKAKIK